MCRMIGDQRLRAIGIVAWMLAACALGAGTANASPRWTWESGSTAPPRLDPQSCPSASLCVGMEQNSGEGLLISTNPTVRSSTWTQTAIDRGNLLTAVSCPTTSFCVAVDERGNVITSDDPTGGPSAWKAVSVDPASYDGLSQLSCPSTRLCVALDGSGSAVISRHPPGGPTAWKIEQVDPNISSACYHEHKTGPNCDAALEFLACPSSSMCVASDDSGRMLTSKDPGAGSKKWSSWGPRTPDYNWLIGISCPTVHFCLGGDGNGVAAWNPTRPRTNPYSVGDDQGGILGEFCPSASQCFTWLNRSQVFSSTGPGSAKARWTPTTLPGGVAQLLEEQSMSCPTAATCLASVATFTGDELGPPLQQDSLDLVTVSRDQFVAALRRTARQHQLRSKADLERAHGTTVRFDAPTAGTLTINLSRRVSHHQLLGIVRDNITQGGPVHKSLVLAPQARQWLQATTNAAITAKLTFVPTGATAISITRQIGVR